MKCKIFKEKEWETLLKITTIFLPLLKKIYLLFTKIYGVLKALINTN